MSGVGLVKRDTLVGGRTMESASMRSPTTPLATLPGFSLGFGVWGLGFVVWELGFFFSTRGCIPGLCSGRHAVSGANPSISRKISGSRNWRSQIVVND